MNAAELRIRTPEGIVFAYRLAGPLPRAFAWLLDLGVILMISSGVAKGLGMLNVVSGDLCLI